ncbi:HMA2 domain-containing protein [Campylobacterota bacterium DY0563]
MITVDKLIEIGSYLTLIHHIKGRIRVRVSPKIKEQSGNISLEDIEDIPNKINGIKKIKINKVIGSITIEYDNSIFPDKLWKDMINQENLEEIAKILNKLTKEVV